MADELVETQVAETVVTEPTPQQQIAEQMNFRLNGEIPKTGESQGTETVAVTEPVVTKTEPPVFQFHTFTEKYGWQSPEDAVKEIEELRGLKANPTPAEIKYENEQSEKLAKALQAGKIDEVYGYLDDQRRLEKLTTAEVTKDTANDIIKLSMQLKYKEEGLTADEIDYKFRKMYGLPKEPVGEADDEEFIEKHKEWKETVSDIEAGKIIDAKVAKRELEAAKSKLVLPNIEETVDEDYLQYKKGLEDKQKLADEAEAEYKTLNPKSIETKLNFNDEANKIQFDFQFEPDQEGFKEALEVVTNPEKYRERYSNPDGSYNRKKFLEDQYFSMNREKVLMEAMKQAKNATLKAQLPDNSNNGLGGKQLPQNQEPSELHKQMQAAGVVR